MNALTAPAFLLAEAARVDRPSFAALVYAETGLTPEELAEADSTDLITIHECWLRAGEGEAR